MLAPAAAGLLTGRTGHLWLPRVKAVAYDEDLSWSLFMT